MFVQDAILDAMIIIYLKFVEKVVVLYTKRKFWYFSGIFLGKKEAHHLT